MRAESLASEDFAAADFHRTCMISCRAHMFFYRISLEMPASPKSWMLIGLPIEPAGVKVLAFGVFNSRGTAQPSLSPVALQCLCCQDALGCCLRLRCSTLHGFAQEGSHRLADAAYQGPLLSAQMG